MTRNSNKLFDELKQTRQRPRAGAKNPGKALPGGTVDSLFLKATANAKPAPRSILFVKSDSYGDLVLFAPALAWLRAYWPDTRIGLLMKQRHQDVAPLLPAGVTYLFTLGDPHVEEAADSLHVDEIVRLVADFVPEILVAPSYEKTWVHGIAAGAAKDARRISVGPAEFDAATGHYLQQRGFGKPDELYPEQVEVEASAHELEKARMLLSRLCNAEIPPLLPELRLPAAALTEADRLIAGWRLPLKGFVLCNPAGTANVSIKAWPPRFFAEVLTWLYAKHKLPVLLCVHCDERTVAEEVVGLLGKSVQVSVWLGEAGQLPLMAALASRARVYFGADTSTMHVAEAVGTPVVAVFGGGHWPRFRPVLPESLALVHPLPCFGCGWHCHLDDALCIKLIQPADVIAAWGRRLAKEAPRALRSGTVELSRLSPELLQSLGRSRQLYEHDQRDSEERYAQILRLTVLARENEKTIVTLNNAAAELQAQNQSLKTALATSQGGMTEQASRLRAAEDSGTELARQNREVATIAQQAQAAAGRQQEQVVQLTALLKQSETEALARSRQIDQLTQLALTWEADANPRQQQIGSLTALLRAAEESRAELMRQNRELTTMVQQAQTDASAQREQVNQLTALFKASETESLARSGQIDQLTKLALTREADANARQQQIETLTAMVEAAQEAGASLQRQIGELTALLSTADEARAQLLQLNRELVSDARRQTAQWRESLLGLSREASLGSQLLAKLAAQTPTAPGDHPLLPIPCPGSPPAEEEIVFNVESFETSGDGMSVNGWAFLRSARDCRNTHIALALVVGDAWFVVPAAVVARPDVAAAHPCQDGTERYRSHAGFHCRFDRRALPALPVTVHLILQAGDAPGLYSPGFALPA